MQQKLSTKLSLLLLLALQFAAQPTLNRVCGTSSAITSTIVIATEVCKIVLGTCSICLFHKRGWRQLLMIQPKESLMYAGIPAVIYAFQNILILTATKHLDGLTLNLINQTKIIFGALFVYLLLGRPQSLMQCVALALMLGASFLLSYQTDASTLHFQDEHWFLYGIVPILLASVLSGLAAALTQYTLQGKHRISEIFSMELAVFSIITISVNMLLSSSELQTIKEHGIFAGWSVWTLLPVLSSAIGGLLVGLVVKHLGAVQKGFAIIIGLILTAMLDLFVHHISLNIYKLFALPIVAAATVLHISFPPSAQQQRQTYVDVTGKIEKKD